MNKLSLPALIVLILAILQAPSLGQVSENLVPDSAAAQALTTSALDKLSQAELLFCFQGKGSSLSYDVGVITKAAENITAIRSNRVVLSANSSGALLAVYFACNGFGPESIERCATRIQKANLSVIRGNENIASKTGKLLLNQKTELPPEAMKEFIAIALNVEDWQNAKNTDEVIARSRTRLQYPIVIAAANHEILNNRGTTGVLSSRNEKVFQRDNLAVSWKPEIYQFYLKNPRQFLKDHPELKLGTTPQIGKACTYFVNESMYELLSRLPVEERLGDLRLMRTPADMALAIRASAAEPTYFEPVPETQPALLTTSDRLGDLGNSIRRSYCGGFIMPLLAHDVRRMLPQVRVMGTSIMPLPKSARTLLESWYVLDAQHIYTDSHWWCDFDVAPTETIQRQLATRVLTPAEEYRCGLECTASHLAVGKSTPRLFTEPKFTTAAKFALQSDPDDTIKNNVALPSQRGLGKLLEKQIPTRQSMNE